MATSFCAAWTVAALAALSRSRADSVTMFDLTGPRGLMGDAVNPVARVFGWLAARSERSLLPIRSSDSDRLAILSLGGGELQTLIMANLTPNPVAVRIARRDAVELDAYQVVVVTDGTLASLT